MNENINLLIINKKKPLHLGHCELLVRACRLGAVIHPPSPAFYTQPRTVDDIIDQTVARLLDMFDVEMSELIRWQGNH